MVTRFFFPLDTASDVNPAFGGWVENDGMLRRKTVTTKGASTITIGTRLSWAAGTNQGDRQYVSSPMDAGNVFTTATTFKSQLMTREYNLGDNSTSRLIVKIVSEDGNTLRATLLALAQFGPATEYINNATHRNKTFADGDTSQVNYTTVAGDRFVIEIGHADATGATPEASSKWGENATDLPENETQTTDGAGWFETSLTITFQAPTEVTRQVQWIQDDA